MSTTNVIRIKTAEPTNLGRINGYTLYQANNGLIFSVPPRAVPEATSESLRTATLECFFERNMRDLERVCAAMQRLP